MSRANNHQKTFFVTTPIYYPSGKLHIGHAYTTTVAAMMKNYKRLRGYEVRLLTGADEHGEKIIQTAIKNNLSPQEYVDRAAKEFMQLWNALGIEIDYFSRTTNANHKHAVATIFSELLKKDDIYLGEYSGLYSVPDEEFLTELQAQKKDGKFYHPISGHELKRITEASYFLRLSRYQEWFGKFITSHPDFIFPQKVVNEIMHSFVDRGLEDLSVSRTSFNWGVTVKEDPRHVVYVWIDALSNYISALGYQANDDADFQKFWTNGTEIVHVVGKEIARFHGLYWPIMLHALGIRLPDKIIAHGWIVVDGDKMSKSKNNIIEPLTLIAKYGAEPLKYFLMTQIHLGQDGSYSETELIDRINSDLVNNYGNLVSRTVALINKNFASSPVPYDASRLTSAEVHLFTEINAAPDRFAAFFDAAKLDQAVLVAIQLAASCNKYIDKIEPWRLKDDQPRLTVVLNALLNAIYTISVLLSTVLPVKAKEALALIGVATISWELMTDYTKFDKSVVKPNKILFARIERQ